jgi:hypothetical protein
VGNHLISHISNCVKFENRKGFHNTVSAKLLKYTDFHNNTVYASCILTQGSYSWGGDYSEAVDEYFDSNPHFMKSTKYPIKLNYDFFIKCDVNEYSNDDPLYSKLLARFIIYFNYKSTSIYVGNDLYHTKNKITDCVTRTLECAKPLFETENPEFTFDGIEYSNGVASEAKKDSQAEKYNKITAPEFTMTQCTLREQLKIIGSFIHAEPRLKNGVIYFDELHTLEKSSLQNNLNYVRKAPYIDVNNYCTSVIGFGKNISTSLDSNSNQITTLVRSVVSEKSNERLTENNAVALTEHKIKEIKKIEFGIYQNGDWKVPLIDVTDYLLEETVYSSLASDYDNADNLTKAMSIYYTIGQNNVRGMFYISPAVIASDKTYSIANILSYLNNTYTAKNITNMISANPENLYYRITYVPQYDAVVTHGKNFYDSAAPKSTQIHNQTENMINADNFGENVKGVAARLGNVEEERTYILDNLSDIPKTGTILDGFAIADVTTEIAPYHIKCTVALSKDFNRISEYVGLNSIKRLYEISEREVYDRNIVIDQTLVVRDFTSSSLTKKKPIVSCIGQFYHYFKTAVSGWNYKKVNIAQMTAKDVDKNEISSLIYPALTSNFGNTEHLSFSAKDNYSAGTSLEYGEGKDDVAGYWNKDVRYTDYFGEIYWADFTFMHYNNSDAPTKSMPDLKLNDGNSLRYATVQNYRMRKDSREKISITLNINAKSGSDGIIVGSALTKLGRAINDVENETGITLWLFVDDFEISKFAKNISELKRGSAIAKTPNNEDSNNKLELTFSYLKEDGNIVVDATDDWHTDAFRIMTNHANAGHGYILTTNAGDILLMSTEKNTDVIGFDFYITRD